MKYLAISYFKALRRASFQLAAGILALVLCAACAEAPPPAVSGSPIAVLTETVAPTSTTTTVPASPTTTATATSAPATPTPQAPAPPPIQPLGESAIVDTPVRNMRALTDGSQKYRIAAWGPGTSLVALVPQDGRGLDLVDVESGQVTPIVTDTYVLEPQWTGDGRLLVHRTTSGIDTLTLYDPRDGWAPAPLVSGPPLAAPSIGDDLLTFSQAGQVHLCRDRCQASRPVVAGGALVTALAQPAEHAPMLAWSPEVADLEEVQTFVAEIPDGAEAGLLDIRPVSAPGEGLWLPRWSPDGGRVTLTGIGGRLVVAAIDGSSRIDLGPGDSPAWSPDGRRIAYAGASAGLEFTTRDIHIIRADGTGQRLRLTDANEEQFYVSPTWSPDGRQLAFVEIDSGRLFVGDAP